MIYVVCIAVLTIAARFAAELSDWSDSLVGVLTVVLVFRVVALYIVQHFIDDLEAVVTGSKQMI